MNHITSVFQNFIDTEDFDCVVEEGEEYAALPNENRITWAPFCNFDVDRMFMQYARQLGLQNKVSFRVLSFLHEVGHIETFEEVSGFDVVVYKVATFLLAKPLLPALRRNWIYFHLPIERRATQWAVDYINENYDIVRRLMEDLRK